MILDLRAAATSKNGDKQFSFDVGVIATHYALILNLGLLNKTLWAKFGRGEVFLDI